MQISFLKNKFSGFTLIELSVSLFILTLLIGFAMPRFSTLFKTDLEKKAIEIASILTNLKNEALLKQENYKLIFDTQHETYSIYTQNKNNLDQYLPHIKYASPIALPPPITFQNISRHVTEKNQPQFEFEKLKFDKIFGQQFELKIDSSGFVDLFELTLKNDQSSITISIVNIMGKIEIGTETPL